jgi:hypothetical protein
MKVVRPFSEDELKDLNNFWLLFAPGNSASPPAPSGWRGVLTEVKSLDVSPRSKGEVPGEDPSDDQYARYSNIRLDQTGEQFLSAVETTAASIAGSFRAAQDVCCNYVRLATAPYKRHANAEAYCAFETELAARKAAWCLIANPIYRALREKGYSPQDLRL